MTPYLTATAATIPAPPKPAKETSHTRETESKTVSTDKNEDISKDSSGFEDLMAALLNAPPLTQSQTSVKTVVKTVANDQPVANISTDAAAGTQTPLVVVPQNTSASSLATATTSGDFSQELLSALTPGVPAMPVADAQADAVPVSVPVPTISKPSTDVAVMPMPELTIDPDMVPADPRLIASGLSPDQMQAVKDQMTASKPQAPATTNANAANIMTVAITPDKSAPVVASSPVNDIVASVVVTPAKPAPAATETKKPVLNLPVDTMASISADVIDEGFDPVEFRIAQGFQRPASSASSAITAQANTQTPAQTTAPTGYQGNADTGQAAANTVTKGKIDLPPLSSSSPTISTALSADAMSAGDAVSTSPVALPMVANPLTSPVVQSHSATQSIPAVQTVAAIINKAAKDGGPQTISLRLDPPELGKLEVQMKYNKGDPLKVHLVVEKADTAQLFQKDAHVLEAALKDAGIQTDGSSLSFEFSQGNSSFNQAMGHDQSSRGQNQAWTPSAGNEVTPVIETSMDVYTDSKTGLTHYNIRA